MNIVEFRAVFHPVSWDPGILRVVDIAVDGVSLIELVREVERPDAEAEEAARAGEYPELPPGAFTRELAGTYLPLSTRFAWPSRHFLGEPLDLPHGGEDGETMLLGCTCGIDDCWALLARVVLTEQTVTWSGFRNNSRDWDLSGLGPFDFNRRQYEASLRSTAG